MKTESFIGKLRRQSNDDRQLFADDDEPKGRFVAVNTERCQDLLDRMDRGETVSMTDVRKAIGSELRHEMESSCAVNSYLKTLDKKAKTILRHFDIEATIFNLHYRNASDKKSSDQVMRKIWTRYNAALLHLSELMAEYPWLADHLSPPYQGPDVEDIPRRVDRAVSLNYIKRTMLEKAIAGQDGMASVG